jgi:hypothetical protein
VLLYTGLAHALAFTWDRTKWHSASQPGQCESRPIVSRPASQPTIQPGRQSAIQHIRLLVRQQHRIAAHRSCHGIASHRLVPGCCHPAEQATQQSLRIISSWGLGHIASHCTASHCMRERTTHRNASPCLRCVQVLPSHRISTCRAMISTNANESTGWVYTALGRLPTQTKE